MERSSDEAVSIGEPLHDPPPTAEGAAPPPAQSGGNGAPPPEEDKGPKVFISGSAPTSFVRAPTIVIRPRRGGGDHGGAHGGSWKIAYADFVTAMMAFFLLLWLLTTSNKGDLAGIAEYFNRPLQSAFKEGPGASATTAPAQKSEQQQLDDLKARIESIVQQNPKLQAYKNQIKLEITSQGLRIQIIDDKNRPMFGKGDAVLKDYTREILASMASALNGVPNHLSLAGHTDALPYSGNQAGYSNWELSTERANSARRELVEAGMQADKVLEIRGVADSLPLLKNDPSNAANRRITIVVLNAAAEQTFKRDGVQAPSDSSASPSADATPAEDGTPAP